MRNRWPATEVLDKRPELVLGYRVRLEVRRGQALCQGRKNVAGDAFGWFYKLENILMECYIELKLGRRRAKKREKKNSFCPVKPGSG